MPGPMHADQGQRHHREEKQRGDEGANAVVGVEHSEHRALHRHDGPRA